MYILLQFCLVLSSFNLSRIINILQVLDQHFLLFEAGKVAELPRFCKRPNLVSASINLPIFIRSFDVASLTIIISSIHSLYHDGSHRNVSDRN